MKHKIAIDIGTTNLEYALVDDEHNIISEGIQPNVNRKYGPDVMTRITKACDGLLTSMTSDLRAQIRSVCNTFIYDYDISNINIAANTTMVHILMGYDCSSLGHYPFTPYNKDAVICNAATLDIVPSDYNITANIFPCMSAFIGGDIISGLSTLPLHDSQDILYTDLGTNAEMVYITSNAIYTASAAAGPAFETCSVGHGSDAIEALAYMLKNNIIDETGLLQDKYFESGYDCMGIHFSQRKIRDFQMAKSAIRTGLDILLSADTSPVLYIAGNFGQHLDVESAIAIGMLPDYPFANIIALGNASLKGAQGDFDFTSVPAVINNKKIEEIVLSNHPDFNDMFINNLNY